MDDLLIVLLSIIPQLRADRAIALKAVSIDGSMYEKLTQSLRGYEDIALAAIAVYAPAIGFCAPRLRSARAFVSRAVNLNPSSLQYCLEKFKDDREVILSLCHSPAATSYELAQHFSPRLRRDKEVVISFVRRPGCAEAIQFASEALREDKEVVLAAVSNDGEH